MRGAGPWLQQTGKRAEVASIVSRMLIQYIRSRGRRIVLSLTALGLALLLLLASCTSGGDQGQATAPSAPSPRVERQAIDNLLALYQEAVVAEDSDRLPALLAPATALARPRPLLPRVRTPPGAFADPTALQDTLRATFQQTTVTALAIPPETVVIAPDQSSVTFLEVESTLDPQTVAQHTRVYRTTWGLSHVGTGVVRVGISAVRRAGPLVEVTTAGLLVAGPPQPLTVRAPTAAFALAAVEVPGPGAGAVQRVAATRGQVQETFTAAAGTELHALPVRALGTNGETLVFAAPLPLAPGARGDRATRGGDRDDAVSGGDGGARRHGVGRGR